MNCGNGPADRTAGNLPETRSGGKITRSDDGKYCWTYELNLYKNPTVFVTVWLIFFFILLGITAVTCISDLVNWGPETLLDNLRFLLYFFIGMTAVVALGYVVYALIVGGRYIVEFEMDEKGINHRQIPSQAEKAKKIGEVTAMAGYLSKRPSVTGAGIMAQRTEMYSDFEKVRHVRPCPRRNMIKLNSPFSRNQVYAAKEDFPFVTDYILSHCNNLKKR